MRSEKCLKIESRDFLGIEYLLNEALPLFAMEIFLLNACRNLISNLTPDQDVFEKKNYEILFQ